jgi:GDP-4-dehydro-6-deoxy-D-mannose reductase
MKPKVLITGADGFVGRHLAAFLADRAGAQVLGLDMGEPRFRQPWDRCDYEVCNILQRERVFFAVERFRPDYVFHLAAQSSVGLSWKDPQLTYEIALSGQSNLLDAIQEKAPHATVHIACSAEEYGRVRQEDLPIKEGQPLRPASPYALSKVMQDYHSIFCHQAYGTRTIITRAFNMTGPGQSPNFVVSDFAKQIAEAEAGTRQPLIRVGNLEARRDFSDVRDLVEVYWGLVQKGEPGEAYNVCSGTDHSIKEILDALLSLSTVDIKVETDASRMREADIPVLRGDNRKLRDLLDWKPNYSMQETLEDVLDWWRARIGKGGDE